MLWRIVLKSWLSSSVDVASYAHSLVDLPSNVSSRVVRVDSVMSHARDRVSNAFYRYTSQHL